MLKKNLLFKSFLIGIFLLPNSNLNSAEDKKEPTPPPSSIGVSEFKIEKKAEEAIIEKFVKNALDFAKKRDRSKALGAFNDKDSEFSIGRVYIYALDYKGNMLANVEHTELVDKNQYDSKDEDGKYYVRDMIEKAKSGGGWIQYRSKDPDNNQIECVRSYVMPLNDYFIGSDYSYAPNKDGKCE